MKGYAFSYLCVGYTKTFYIKLTQSKLKGVLTTTEKHQTNGLVSLKLTEYILISFSLSQPKYDKCKFKFTETECILITFGYWFKPWLIHTCSELWYPTGFCDHFNQWFDQTKHEPLNLTMIILLAISNTSGITGGGGQGALLPRDFPPMRLGKR